MKKILDFKQYIILIIGVVGIGFSPALVKLLGTDGMGPAAIGFWRNIIGAIFLFGLAKFKNEKLVIGKNTFKWAILGGLFFSLDLNFWHRSVMYAGSGIATVIGNMQVFVTSILSVYFFKEKLSVRFLFSSILAVFGVILLSGLMNESITLTYIYKKGIFYACVTAFMYGFFLISVKKSGTEKSKPSPMVFMGWISFFSAMFLALSCFSDHGTFLPSTTESIIYMILLGVIVQGVCWLMIASAMAHIKTHITSLLLLLQPAMAVLWGYIFFKEILTNSQIIGVVIILTTVYIGSLSKQEVRNK